MMNHGYTRKMRKIALIAALTGLAPACTQYIERNEGITFSAGDAVAHNKAVQMIDPWPPHAGRTGISANGERMLVALKKYRENKPAETEGGNTSNTQDSKSSEE